jgi:hypothetical protein
MAVACCQQTNMWPNQRDQTQKTTYEPLTSHQNPEMYSDLR